MLTKKERRLRDRIYELKHAEEINIKRKILYNKYKKMGLCIKGCGNKVEIGKTMCHFCLNKKLKHIEILKKTGFCVSGCGRKATKNTQLCFVCLQNHNRRHKSRILKLKRNNLCITCGKKTSFGRIRCKKCLHMAYLNVKKYINTPIGKVFAGVYAQKRRAMKFYVIHNFTKEQWLKKLELANNYCNGCKKDKKKLTMDHIYPLSKALEDFMRTGIKRIYTIKDVFPVCGNCNSSKGKKLIKWN